MRSIFLKSDISDTHRTNLQNIKLFPKLNITPSSISRSMKRRDKESDKMIYGISTTDPDSTIEEIRKWSTLENEEFDRDMY